MSQFTLFDQALIYGFAIGVGASVMFALGCWVAWDEGRAPRLPTDDADAPFRPSDKDL
jgi:preprotein translocase subunit SecF